MLLRLLLLSALVNVSSHAPTPARTNGKTPAAITALGQGTAPVAITRQAGTDPDSGIQWAMLSSSGKRISPASADSPPQLAAQCYLVAPGKYRFELLTDFGHTSAPLEFAAPWHPRPGELFPPNLGQVPLTMQFLGYTRYKPVRRQWEALQQPSGWLRYATPGMRSPNMEQIMFYLQVLRALPTLRLIDKSGAAVEFETTSLQQAIHAEPLCHASGL
jgi:hypothetical protein